MLQIGGLFEITGVITASMRATSEAILNNVSEVHA